MNLFTRFRRGSAPIARERLQILLAHERVACSQPDLLRILNEEILVVIKRHVSFDLDRVQIKMNCGKSLSTLAVEFEIPNGIRAPGVVQKPSRLALYPGREVSLSRMNQRVC